MLTKTITYTDYNGVERTEDFLFNLNQAELIEMQLGNSNGLYSDQLKKMIDSHDGAALIKTIREFVVKSYGEKSEDGKRFIKSPEISEAFTQTEAFSQLLTELLSDDAKATEFILGIMPQGLREAAVAEMNKNNPMELAAK